MTFLLSSLKRFEFTANVSITWREINTHTHLLVHLRVGDLALVARVVALPEEGRLAPALLEVSVQAVVAQVGLGVPHPLHVDLALEGVGIKFELVNLQK